MEHVDESNYMEIKKINMFSLHWEKLVKQIIIFPPNIIMEQKHLLEIARDTNLPCWWREKHVFNWIKPDLFVNPILFDCVRVCKVRHIFNPHSDMLCIGHQSNPVTLIVFRNFSTDLTEYKFAGKIWWKTKLLTWSDRVQFSHLDQWSA